MSHTNSGISASFLGQELRGGRYVIQQKIAQGGSAWLFKALHKTLDEPMAVKLLYPQYLENHQIRRRFIEEARIQFRLKHHNIVHITDIIDENFCLGSVMEWIEGEDLRAYLHRRNSPLTNEEIEKLFLPVLGALHYVHQQGFVHRDIKPANILIARSGQQVTPKLTDFGIAKIMFEEGNTATGSTLGTVTYMAPEQIHDSKQVTPRSDIYSVGVLLYQMFVGHVPFQGTPQQQLVQHLNEEPIPPRKVNNKIPKKADKLVMSCLAKEAEKRPESCEQVLNELFDIFGADVRATFLQLPTLPPELAPPIQSLSQDLEGVLDHIISENSSDDMPTTITGNGLETPPPVASFREPMKPVFGNIAELELEQEEEEDTNPAFASAEKSVSVRSQRRQQAPKATPQPFVVPKLAPFKGAPVPTDPDDRSPLIMILSAAVGLLLVLVGVLVVKMFLNPTPSTRLGKLDDSTKTSGSVLPNAPANTAQVCFTINPDNTAFRFKMNKKIGFKSDSFCVYLKKKSRFIIWRQGYHDCEFSLPKKDANIKLHIHPKHVDVPSDQLDYCTHPEGKPPKKRKRRKKR